MDGEANTQENAKVAESQSGMNQQAVERRRQFSGSYNHSLDSKGRLIIPAAYRDALGGGFTVGPSKDFSAIALYPQDEWDRFSERLSQLNPLDTKAQKVVQMFNKFSYTCQEGDTQGRLLLPVKLRKLVLKDARDVEVSGAQSYVRIEACEKADKENEDFFNNPDEFLEAAREGMTNLF